MLNGPNVGIIAARIAGGPIRVELNLISLNINYFEPETPTNNFVFGLA